MEWKERTFIIYNIINNIYFFVINDLLLISYWQLVRLDSKIFERKENRRNTKPL